MWLFADIHVAFGNWLLNNNTNGNDNNGDDGEIN